MMYSPQPHFPESNDELRLKIDEEIAQLEARLLVLKSSRNALAPIARLQPEILQEIFFLSHGASKHKGKTVLVISWICRRWRHLTQETSGLWSIIDFHNIDWIQSAISRTKGRDLEFNLAVKGKLKGNRVSLAAQCIENLSRINKFTITSSSQNAIMGLPPLEPPGWSIPAPSLVDLHLEKLSIPADLFSGVYPSLKSLGLIECNFNWTKLPIIPGLTTFVIKDPTTRITISHLVYIIHAIGPDLEHVELKYVTFLQSVGLLTPDIKVHFTKLESLRLKEDSPESIALLLRHLSLPPSADIYIDFERWEETSIIQALAASRRIDRWPISVFEIITDHPSVSIIMLERQGGTDPGEMRNNPRSWINLDIADFDNLSHLLPLFQALPIKSIETLCFSTTDNEINTDTTIIKYFGTLGIVKELFLEPTFLGSFLGLIQQEMEALDSEATHENMDTEPDDASSVQAAQVQPQISFHNLQYINIDGRLDDGFSITFEGLYTLQRWLTLRKRYGFELETLLISGVNVPCSADYLKQLFEGLVEEFETTDVGFEMVSITGVGYVFR